MKNLSKTTAIALLFCSNLTFSGIAHSQDLSDLFPFAYYPLINTPDDALGFQSAMQLINTVYEGDDGIFFNGKHPVVDQGGSWARTYNMSALYESKFAVQVEFRMDDLDDQYRCIIVCGLATLKEYLGLFLVSNNKFSILLSGGEFVDIPDINPQENVWYKFTMVYDTLSNNAKFYFGNNLVESANHQLVRYPFDGYVNNLYLPAGYPLEGNWRNLRIYGSEEVTALEDELDRATKLDVFPNPAGESLMINGYDKQIKSWNIYDASGQHVLSGHHQQQMQIDLSSISQGNYFLQLLDRKGIKLVTKPFVKM